MWLTKPNMCSHTEAPPNVRGMMTSHICLLLAHPSTLCLSSVRSSFTSPPVHLPLCLAAGAEADAPILHKRWVGH